MRDHPIFIRAAAMATLVIGIVAVAPLSAKAGPPPVRGIPDPVAFRATELGHTEEHKVVLRNESRLPTKIEISPEARDSVFGHGHSSCSQMLSRNESCEVTVWFKPRHWGHTTGRLTYCLGGSQLNCYQIHLVGEAREPQNEARASDLTDPSRRFVSVGAGELRPRGRQQLSSDPRVKYAWICRDVIGVGNLWREVPEIEEVGSSWTDLLGASAT